MQSCIIHNWFRKINFSHQSSPLPFNKPRIIIIKCYRQYDDSIYNSVIDVFLWSMKILITRKDMISKCVCMYNNHWIPTMAHTLTDTSWLTKPTYKFLTTVIDDSAMHNQPTCHHLYGETHITGEYAALWHVFQLPITLPPFEIVKYIILEVNTISLTILAWTLCRRQNKYHTMSVTLSHTLHYTCASPSVLWSSHWC